MKEESNTYSLFIFSSTGLTYENCCWPLDPRQTNSLVVGLTAWSHTQHHMDTKLFQGEAESIEKAKMCSTKQQM